VSFVGDADYDRVRRAAPLDLDAAVGSRVAFSHRRGQEPTPTCVCEEPRRLKSPASTTRSSFAYPASGTFAIFLQQEGPAIGELKRPV
jgi:hypothetical protein